MAGIRIDALDAVASATRNHEVPAMKDNATAKLTVGQILDIVIDNAPEDLDTLAKISDAIGNDPDFAATISAALAAKLSLSGGTMTGAVTLAASGPSVAPLVVPSGSDPSSPSDGQLWRNATGLVLRKSGVSAKILDGQSSIRVSVAVIGDQKAQGTSAKNSSATANAWTLMDLNTEFSDPDGIVTIASNQFTLLAGANYLVSFRSAYTSLTELVNVRVYNVTDGAYVAGSISPSNYASIAGNTLSGTTITEIVLAGGKTYQFEYSTQGSNKPMGQPRNVAGMPEIYSAATIVRLTNVID